MSSSSSFSSTTKQESHAVVMKSVRTAVGAPIPMRFPTPDSGLGKGGGLQLDPITPSTFKQGANMSTPDYQSNYHSSITSRDSFGRGGPRSVGGGRATGGGGGGRVLQIVTEMGSSSFSGISPAFGANAASAIIESREKEKKEMQDLNDRLSNYIERVRFLEQQNRKLAAELEDLRSRWGKDTGEIKTRFDGQLSEARRLMDESAKNKAEIEVQIARLELELNEMRYKMDDAIQLRNNDKEAIDMYTSQLSDIQTEIQLLRRRLQNLVEEQQRYRSDNDRIADELNKARNDLDQESISRIDYQNQTQTLLEEIEFYRRVHDQEVKELQTLASSHSTLDNKEYFKNEIALAIRDIRHEYDAIAHQGKQDMESWYKLKVQEVQGAASRNQADTTFQKDEVTRMRSAIGDSKGKLADLENKNASLAKRVQELTYQLEDDARQYEGALNDRDAQVRRMREESQALMIELQMLLDTKQTLDAEIAIYRKMLEGEENRAGLRTMVEQAVKTHSLHQQEETDSSRVVKGETSTRTSFSRSAKGNVVIADVHPDGKYITLENTHRSKDEKMDEWKIRRKIDGRREVVYTLPSKYVLKAEKSVKIWSKNGGGSSAPPDQLVMDDEDSWLSGMNVQTILYNKDGDERATHNQRTQTN